MKGEPMDLRQERVMDHSLYQSVENFSDEKTQECLVLYAETPIQLKFYELPFLIEELPKLILNACTWLSMVLMHQDNHARAPALRFSQKGTRGEVIHDQP